MIKDPELLKLAIKTIETDPRRWNQGAWNFTEDAETVDGFAIGSGVEMWGAELQDLEHCGTTLCLAGHVVVLAGQRPLAGMRGYGKCIDPETGTVSDIAAKAAELLGLDSTQAGQLFYGGGSSVRMYKRLVTKVTGVTFE
jgi:hypothetical protein